MSTSNGHRTYELTYFRPRRRWKKKIQGRVVYFGRACNKTDRAAYQHALAEYRANHAPTAPWHGHANTAPADIPGVVDSESVSAFAVNYKTVDGLKNTSVGACVRLFLEELKQMADSGEKSKAYYAQVKAVIRDFTSYVGADRQLQQIDGLSLKAYQSELLDKVQNGQISTSTANHRLKQAKRLIRWAWELEIIDDMPRILISGSKDSLTIGGESPAIKVYNVQEVRDAFEAAGTRMKCFIALACNCIFTQSNIADLLCSELDWDNRTITKRRNKTRRYRSVPAVTYPLWPVTQTLLEQCAANKKMGLVLLNRNGKPLLTQQLVDGGRLKKTDNIRNAWNRLVVKLVQQGKRRADDQRSFKHYRKTSATLLNGSTDYASLRFYCLGQSPQRVADKYYAQPPRKLIQEAIVWLGDQYALDSCI